MTWLVVLVAVLSLWAVLRLTLPPSRRRWPVVEALARWAAARSPRRRRTAPDPFEVLRVQTRLGALAAEIHELEQAPRVYAKVRRLVALNAAYDDLLDEACRLAGVPPSPDRRGEELRWHEEQELAARGWSW